MTIGTAGKVRNALGASSERIEEAQKTATLLANGVTLLAGLSIVKDTMTNSVLASALSALSLALHSAEIIKRRAATGARATTLRSSSVK